MRKEQPDDFQETAGSVLAQAASDPSYAQHLQNNPPDLLAALGLPVSQVAHLTVESGQLCLSIPALGFYECVGRAR